MLKLKKNFIIIFLMGIILILLSACAELDIDVYSLTIRTEVAETSNIIPNVSIQITGDRIEPKTVTTGSDGQINVPVLQGEVTLDASDLNYNDIDYVFETKVVNENYDGQLVILKALASSEVQSEEEFSAALNNQDISLINLNEDIIGDFVIERAIVLKGNNGEIQGDLSLGTGEEIDISIYQLSITGQLTIDVGRSTVNLEDLVSSKVLVESVGNDSLYLQGNTEIGELEVESAWSRIDIDTDTIINKIILNENAIGTIITGSAANIQLVEIYSEQVYFEESPQATSENTWFYPFVLFKPGIGGTIPSVPEFSAEAGKIANLLINYNHMARKPSLGGDGAIAPRIHFDFHSEPSGIGADSFTLEYSEDGQDWFPCLDKDEEEITTDLWYLWHWAEGDYYYRLKVNGGDKDGYVSNVVYAPRPNKLTRFTGKSLNGMDMHTQNPYLEATFNVEGFDDDDTDYNELLSYKWYRVNPKTFAREEITGVDGLIYDLREEDLGYAIICRAYGEEIGGFAESISFEQPMFSNRVYISNITTEGFRLNLYKSLASELKAEHLDFYYLKEGYDWGGELEIISIENVKENAVFDIFVNIPEDAVYLEGSGGSFSQLWYLSTMAGDHGEGMILIKLPPNFVD